MENQDQMTMERLNRIFEELGVKPEQVTELSEPNAYRLTAMGDHIIGLLRTLGFKCDLLSTMPAYDKFRQTTLEWLVVHVPPPPARPRICINAERHVNAHTSRHHASQQGRYQVTSTRTP